MALRRPYWGFGDIAPGTVSTPATQAATVSGATPAPMTADQQAQATAVAEQALSQIGPQSSGTQIHDASEKLKQAMIAVSIEIAAVQLAVSIMLKTALFVVPIGTIIGAILSVIDLFTGAYAKRKTAEIIAAAVNQVAAMMQTAQAQLATQAGAIADQEWGNAQAIAASGVALNGLGDSPFWSDVASPFIRANRAMIQAISTVTFTSAKDTLKLLGDNHDAAKVAQKQQQWNQYVTNWGNHLMVLSAKPGVLFIDMNKIPAEYLFGTRGVEIAKAKCAQLVTMAGQQIAQMLAQGQATMATDAYRQQVRVNLAKLISGDPTMLAQAQQMLQIDAEASQTMADVQHAAAAGQSAAALSSKSGTGIFGTMALIGMWAWLA